ncbi:hypothetical protein ACFL10_01930 [Patescibacteria group bacterium]
MLDALKSGFEEPQNPEELCRLLDIYEELRRKKTQINPTEPGFAEVESQLSGVEATLSKIDEEPDAYKNLLIETAEALRNLILKFLKSHGPEKLPVGYYLDVVYFIKISELLNDGPAAWEVVKQIADAHLDYYNEIKTDDFKGFHKGTILTLVVMLQNFNSQIPGIQDAINLQAEAELLYAHYMRQYFENVEKKDRYGEEILEEIKTRVTNTFEAVYKTALLGTIRSLDHEAGEVYALWEDVVCAYGEWLIRIGETDAAKNLCNEVFIRNPNTTIYIDLGFPDPSEQSLRRLAYKKDQEKSKVPVRANADTQMDAFTKECKAQGLQLEALLAVYEGRILSAARILQNLADLDTTIAQETSGSISGGHPLFKDPYKEKDKDQGMTCNN